MKDRILGKLLDIAIVLACIFGILCAFRTLEEAGRAREKVEWSMRLVPETVATEPKVAHAVEPEIDDGEDPDEDVLIEAALLECGYYRDDVPLPYGLQDALHTACAEFGIRYELALAVIQLETDFRNVTGDRGHSIGYMQIQPRYWCDLMTEIGVDDLTDPSQNFRTGCAILAQLIERYGNEADALTGYNSGHPGGSEYAVAALELAERWVQCGF